MESLLAGSSLGRYRVIELIGRGGMASVFRAHDPDLNRYVAIKVLPSYEVQEPTFADRFRQEAQAVAGLNHPNIIQVYDFGEDKGFIYIVMAHVTGGTLQDRLGGRRLPLDETLELIGPVGEALEYAHGEGVIHRDVKPANVLLDDSGKPILSDFGLARMLAGSAALTRANATVGTPEYMAPEQALGKSADQRSDLYALGIIIYQMLLGEVPFRGETPPETLLAHVHRPVPLPSSVDPDIDPLLEANLVRALAKNPEDRHQSPTELMEALALVSRESGPARSAEQTIGTPSVTQTLASDTDKTYEEARVRGRQPVEATRISTKPGLPVARLAVGVALALAMAAGGLWLALAGGGGDDIAGPPSDTATGAPRPTATAAPLPTAVGAVATAAPLPAPAVAPIPVAAASGPTPSLGSSTGAPSASAPPPLSAADVLTITRAKMKTIETLSFDTNGRIGSQNQEIPGF